MYPYEIEMVFSLRVFVDAVETQNVPYLSKAGRNDGL